MCAGPRTWNTKPISRNTRLDTSGHTIIIIEQRQWRRQQQQQQPQHTQKNQIAQFESSKKSTQNQILWYIRRLIRFLNNCVHVNFSLDYSIQLIFNFRFPILNWLLAWNHRKKWQKPCLTFSFALFSRCCCYCALVKAAHGSAFETYFGIIFPLFCYPFFLRLVCWAMLRANHRLLHYASINAETHFRATYDKHERARWCYFAVAAVVGVVAVVWHHFLSNLNCDIRLNWFSLLLSASYSNIN